MIAFGEEASRKLGGLLGAPNAAEPLDVEIFAAEGEMRACGEKLSALRLGASQRLAVKSAPG